MFGIEATLYPKIFHGLVFVLCLFIVAKHSLSPNNSLLLQKKSVIPMVVLGAFLILFIGLRPVSGRVFGDTANYAIGYSLTTQRSLFFDLSKEWFFNDYTMLCKSWGLSVNVYLLGIEFGYITFLFMACCKLLWESSWLAMLFCISSFSFFSYGTNTLRHGLACAIVAFAIALFAQQKRNILPIILAILAMGIHRSVILPVMACLFASLIGKKIKWLLMVWCGAIPISLLFGKKIVDFFADLGFDERMDQYSVIDMSVKFASHGFRWDFLIYSSLPVLLIWFVQKRIDESGGYRDDGSTALADATSMRVFNILSGTYVLANVFWILVINANFSDRFAYLSWFLYPFVIAYSFIRLHLWEDQDKKIAWVLLAQSCFTFGMFMIGR